jgi:hypothetical protein
MTNSPPFAEVSACSLVTDEAEFVRYSGSQPSTLCYRRIARGKLHHYTLHATT